MLLLIGDLSYMLCGFVCFFFFKQETAYDMRISDWSSDVCSSDLLVTCQDSFSAPPELGTRYAWASAQWGRGRAVNLFESRKFCRVQPIDATSRPSRPEAAILARLKNEH